METKIERLPLEPLFSAKTKNEIEAAAKAIDALFYDLNNAKEPVLVVINGVNMSGVKVYCQPWSAPYLMKSIPASLIFEGEHEGGMVAFDRGKMAGKKLVKKTVSDSGRLSGVEISIK